MSPRHNASQMVDAVNFAGTDRAGNDDLKAFRPFFSFKAVHCFSGRHALMTVAVMPDPDRLEPGYVEIQSSHLEVTALLQFTKPLMRNKKAARNRHGKDAPRMIALAT